MRLLFVTLCLLLLNIDVVLCQEINTDIVGKKMSFFEKLEKKYNGKVYETDGDVIIPGGMATPIMYKRVQKGMPDLIVNYVFTEKDSLMHTVEYEWDVSNYFDKVDDTSSMFRNAFVKKYSELLTLLSSRYGTSKPKGELADFFKIDAPKKLSKSDRWITNENTEVKLYAFGSQDYKSLFKIHIYVSPIRF
ncbi:hypothetical protein [Pedobacter gandavensis]|uniref:hypothetical protein n=1 Tax=Pedobacter gandavensis TaxID=2679963 RepID=UPI00292D45F5|nr:hypothetical protein [Pedobacter gandavensis]